MRYFNTSGPNIVEEHYTLMRPKLVAEGKDNVYKSRYFTIWAPRQTGKSTYFRLLAEELEKEDYKVAYVNFENFKNQSLEDFIIRLNNKLTEFWGILFNKKTLAAIFEQIEELTHLKLVLIIDEVEGINAEYFGDVLHSIRNAYHSRQSHALKSVILVGVSNIVGVVQDNASPFNIADNLNVPYFSDAETIELLTQHETETGQLFDPSVKSKISEITANQPGLVNGFARQLVGDNTQKAIISLDDYYKVEDFYLTKAIDKNISNIINKANRHRSLVERLLFTETKTKFHIYREDIKELYVNGVITYDSDENVVFWVPLYQKCLYQAFYPYINGENDRLRGDLDVDSFILPNGHLDMDKIIINYKEYAKRRGFRHFREKALDGKYKSLKESALMYSFDTFINALIGLVGGKTYLEPEVGLGRSDIVIYHNKAEYVVETKVYSDTVKFAEGKIQLAYYLKSMNLTTGIYLVFVRSTIENPKIKESVEIIDSIEIKTHIIRYDLKVDFKDKKRRKGEEDDDDD